MYKAEKSDEIDSSSEKGERTPPAPKTGIPRLVAAARYSVAGLRAAFEQEEAVRMEVAAFVVLAPLALWLGNTDVERVLLIGSVVLVILVELLNTAIENAVDRVGSDYHELSRVAKDIGSAAVMITMLLVLFTWSVLLIPG